MEYKKRIGTIECWLCGKEASTELDISPDELAKYNNWVSITLSEITLSNAQIFKQGFLCGECRRKFDF